jgi:pectate lyase
MRFAASRIILALALTTAVAAAADKPKLTVKANPTMAFSPARIVVTGDVTGGAENDPQAIQQTASRSRPAKAKSNGTSPPTTRIASRIRPPAPTRSTTTISMFSCA